MRHGKGSSGEGREYWEHRVMRVVPPLPYIEIDGLEFGCVPECTIYPALPTWTNQSRGVVCDRLSGVGVE